MLKDMIVVPTDSTRAGVMAWWSLTGDVDYDNLCNVWNEAGLPDEAMPWEPTADAALLRALQAFWQRNKYRKNVLIRPLRKRGHHAVVFEQVEESLLHENEYKGGKMNHHTLSTAYMVDGAPDLDWHSVLEDTAKVVPKDFLVPTRIKLNELFVEQKSRMSARELSQWLSHTVKNTFEATSLRSKGGIYYIPEWQVGRWELAKEIISSVSAHRIHQIPALHSDDAVAAVLDIVVTESINKVEKIEDALASGELGKRALRTKRAECEDLLERLTSYTKLLGSSLDGIKAQVGDLRANVAISILAEDSYEEDM